MRTSSTRLLRLGAILLLGSAFSAGADSDTPVSIVRVEEDWVLQLNNPDPNTASPQVATQMIPHKDYPDAFAVYCLNYREIPDFWPGGMEIQLWQGKSVLDVDAYAAYELTQAEEVVSWTQMMETKDGKISFSIKNGTSQSFGNFGGSSFSVVQPTGLSDLNNYQVTDSVNNSGIVLGANRVQSLKLVEVRYTMSDGTVITDAKDRPVYTSP